MKLRGIIFIIAIILVGAIGYAKMTGNTINQNIIVQVNLGGDTLGETSITEGKGVKLETNYGDIVIELYNEMPITTGNFKKLIEEGVYDGVIFHRIIDGFMIQGGDPTGTGMGDPKIPNIQDEFTNSDLDRNSRGTISMANAGPNTGSSQFFINLVNNNFLDGKHPVFGKVTKETMVVVDKIAKVKKDAQDRPIDDVVIKKAYLI
jgi:peptidylprolyl isomerase